MTPHLTAQSQVVWKSRYGTLNEHGAFSPISGSCDMTTVSTRHRYACLYWFPPISGFQAAKDQPNMLSTLWFSLVMFKCSWSDSSDCVARLLWLVVSARSTSRVCWELEPWWLLYGSQVQCNTSISIKCFEGAAKTWTYMKLAPTVPWIKMRVKVFSETCHKNKSDILVAQNHVNFLLSDLK